VYERIRAALSAPDRFRRLFDFILAELLFRLPAQVRRRLFSGTSNECPLCGSQLRCFLNLNRPSFLWCPICRSLQRHRTIGLLIRRIQAARPPGHVLHIAPEQALARQLHMLAGTGYLSADLFDPRAMLRLDLSRIACRSGSFDLILCSHVLEHVADDRAAMREIRRVLAPGGSAIILVPILAPQTFEDPSVTDPVARERLFGQHDHVRAYGPDIIERLADAGLHVTRLTTEDMAGPEQIQRYGLVAGEEIFLCNPI
jgi:hypothetical protein